MPTSMTQQNIRSSKSPGFMPPSIARKNIHIAKCPRLKASALSPRQWHRIRIDDPLSWNRFRSSGNGNDDDDDWCGGHCFQARLHPDVDDDLDLGLDQVSVFG